MFKSSAGQSLSRTMSLRSVRSGYTKPRPVRLTVTRQNPPGHYETAPPEELAAKSYGCSGSMEFDRYLEATRFRALHDMDWSEARLALNRLIVEARVRYGRRGAIRRWLNISRWRNLP